ncbi:hypothetical protein DL767_000900 [Monosporascus sp. MG133]|nr:hypothetical protein DL767_000900 [Monosporascus sp. MG133]
MKVQFFFTGLGLPKPTPEEVRDFRATYKHAYREDRRTAPGSIETLIRLGEDGYRLAIVSNGQIDNQTAKAEAIGIRHPVDRLVTSEEAGYSWAAQKTRDPPLHIVCLRRAPSPGLRHDPEAAAPFID